MIESIIISFFERRLEILLDADCNCVIQMPDSKTAVLVAGAVEQAVTQRMLLSTDVQNISVKTKTSEYRWPDAGSPVLEQKEAKIRCGSHLLSILDIADNGDGALQNRINSVAAELTSGRIKKVWIDNANQVMVGYNDRNANIKTLSGDEVLRINKILTLAALRSRLYSWMLITGDYPDTDFMKQFYRLLIELKVGVQLVIISSPVYLYQTLPYEALNDDDWGFATVSEHSDIEKE